MNIEYIEPLFIMPVISMPNFSLVSITFNKYFNFFLIFNFIGSVVCEVGNTGFDPYQIGKT